MTLTENAAQHRCERSHPFSAIRSHSTLTPPLRGGGSGWNFLVGIHQRPKQRADVPDGWR